MARRKTSSAYAATEHRTKYTSCGCCGKPREISFELFCDECAPYSEDRESANNSPLINIHEPRVSLDLHQYCKWCDSEKRNDIYPICDYCYTNPPGNLAPHSNEEMWDKEPALFQGDPRIGTRRSRVIE